MKVSTRLKVVLAATTALFAVTEGSACAQTDTDAMGQIVVTARRVEERLQDVPISITVFNQAQISNRNIVNAEDLADYTPSLTANEAYGASNSSFAIRGLNQDQGTAPTVGTYFADVITARGAAQNSVTGDGAGPGYFYDLQNVQVLKGPQGTLFGRNTTGGAILIVPQKPTSKLEGYVEGSYGNYNMQRIQGALNVPTSDVARFRIAFDHQTRDGYLHNDSGIGPATFDNVHYDTARASLVLDLSQHLENYAIFSYTHSHSNGEMDKMIACNPTRSAANFLGLLSCAQLASHAGDPFFTVQNSRDYASSITTQWQIINATTWHASDALTVKNIFSFAEYRDFDATGLFGTDWQLGGVTLPYVSYDPYSGHNTADESTATEELQVQGRALDQRLTFQAGVYYENSNPLGLVGIEGVNFGTCTNVLTVQCTPLLPGLTSVSETIGKTKFRDVALYTQESYSITDQLKITGGLRYTWDRSADYSDRITYAIPALNVGIPRCTDAATTVLPNCTENLEEKSHAPTWLIDLDYKPTQDVMLYAKYARGYRAGGIYPSAPSNYRIFQPEKDDDFELGAKTSWTGSLPGTFNIDGFYNELRNQQISVGFNAAPGVAVSPTTGIVNAGRSHIYGVEADTSFSPFKGFTVDASYTYLHATIVSILPLVSTDPHFVLSGSIVPGNTELLAPRNKFTITGTYALPLEERLGRLSVAATLNHSDKQLSTFAYNNPAFLTAFGGNLGILAARNLLNLNLNWDSIMGQPFDLSIFATNVTDHHYYAYVPGLAASGFEGAVLGQPRFVGARLRYHFG